MRRCLAWLVAIGLLAGCTSKAPPLQEQPPVQKAEATPETALPPKPAAPREGQWLSRESIPNSVAGAGPTLAVPSPDGKWRAVRTMGIGDNQLWLLAADDSGGVLADADLTGYAEQMLLWSPQGTLLHYRWRDNLWIETDPATGAQKPFLPDLLAGRSAGNLRFSPDGKRLLYNLGVPYMFNKPPASTQTTYVAAADGSATAQVGVDVDAAWDGTKVSTSPRAPRRGYDLFFYMTERPKAGDVYLVGRPLTFGIEILNQQRAQWRVYSADGKQLLKVIPAVESQELTSHGDHRNWWQLNWADPPAEPVRLQLWLEVRPGTPNQPEMIRENSSRWVIAFDIPVMAEEQGPARQTALIDSVHMESPQAGWGTDVYRHLLRTADGGHTWQDVTPDALKAIDGKLQIRRAEFFAPGQAAVAYKFGEVANSTWTSDIYRVRVVHTATGGKSWTEASIDTVYEFVEPVSIGFTGPRDGWLLVRPEYPVRSDTGALYRTADGGSNWNKVADTGTGLPSTQGVTFTDATTGWALGERNRALWQTADGGKSWRKVYEAPPDQLLAGLPQFTGPKEGYLTLRSVKGPQTMLLATTDGGVTWEKRSTHAGFGAATFLDRDTGWIWEYEGSTLHVTRDGGRTWTAYPFDQDKVGVRQVQFVSPQTAFVANRKLYTTADGGKSWTTILPRYAR